MMQAIEEDKPNDDRFVVLKENANIQIYSTLNDLCSDAEALANINAAPDTSDSALKPLTLNTQKSNNLHYNTGMATFSVGDDAECNTYNGTSNNNVINRLQDNIVTRPSIIENRSTVLDTNSAADILNDLHTDETNGVENEFEAAVIKKKNVTYESDDLGDIVRRPISGIATENGRSSSDSLSMPRRVSFPESDTELVTGYLEPANPWEEVNAVKTHAELTKMYLLSCQKHNVNPQQTVLNHILTTDMNRNERQDWLSLRSIPLSANDCEPLEEIFKRIQYKLIDVSECSLDESALIALFQMIEYYEAAVALDVSYNQTGMTLRGWLSCNYMVGRAEELRILIADGNPISKLSAESLGSALNNSCLHTLKLEHCGLKGPPFTSLCFKLSYNQNLKELFLSYNDLDNDDAEVLSDMLRSNKSLEVLDISNNNITDYGIKHLTQALVIQANQLRRERLSEIQTTKQNQCSNSRGIDVTERVTKKEQGRRFCEQDNNLFDNKTVHSNEFTKKNSVLDKLLSIDNNKESEMCDNDSSEIYSTENCCNENLSTSCDERKEKSLVFIIGENEELKLEATNLCCVDPYQSSEKETACTTDQIRSPREEAVEIIEDKKLNSNLETVNSCTDNEVALLSTTYRTELSIDSLSELISPSSESLCSERSMDSCSSSNISFNNKLTKNDTLTRRPAPFITAEEPSAATFNGLKALTLWNNNLTKNCAQYIASLLTQTTSLEILNVGRNFLCNDFVENIKDSLSINRTLTCIGLQSTHISTPGIESLTSALGADGNCNLQRIDIRNNNINIEALEKIIEILSINTVLTQIDINDEPKRLPMGSDDHLEYSRLLLKIRSICLCNKSVQSADGLSHQPDNQSNCNNFPGKRKISLTCHSEPLSPPLKQQGGKIQSAHKKLTRSTTGRSIADTRLRSPVPSPAISPSASPHRSRFRVCPVSEKSIPSLLSPISSTQSETLLKSALSSSCVSIQTPCCDNDDLASKELFTYGSLPTPGSFPIFTHSQSSSQTIKAYSSTRGTRFRVSRIYEDPKLFKMPTNNAITSKHSEHSNATLLEMSNVESNSQMETTKNICPLSSENMNGDDLNTTDYPVEALNFNVKSTNSESGLIVECTRKISSTFNHTTVDRLLTLFNHKPDKVSTENEDTTDATKSAAQKTLPNWTRVGAELLSASITATEEYRSKSNNVAGNTYELSRSLLDSTSKQLIGMGKDFLWQNRSFANDSKNYSEHAHISITNSPIIESNGNVIEPKIMMSVGRPGSTPSHFTPECATEDVNPLSHTENASNLGSSYSSEES